MVGPDTLFALFYLSATNVAMGPALLLGAKSRDRLRSSAG